MNLDFSDDQKQLQDQIRRFLSEKCTPAVVRSGLEGGEPFSRELYRGLGEMGVLGVAIPEAYGGVGLSQIPSGAAEHHQALRVNRIGQLAQIRLGQQVQGTFRSTESALAVGDHGQPGVVTGHAPHRTGFITYGR